ncbi:T5orf172 domain-containing protein [Exophiala viscosa]|uniref:T5orf172 domain-containing protein n=1 Tax=Exophiala viscosa TaxID=2486360 RepID=A0AAN6DS64_9EURO|nr:T5orf172 domain-containing protein [Exophiala viscosa]
MVHIPDVKAFPSLRDFDPLQPHFTCIYPLIGKERNCANRVNQFDRSEASRIQVQILGGVLTGDLTGHLQKLAELSCCKRVHRKSLEELGVLDELCQKWEDDVREIPAATQIKEEDRGDTDPNLTSVQADTPRSEPAESTPRYNLRSMDRNHTGQICHKTGAASLIPDFVPHVKGPSNTFVSVLLRPLPPASSSKASRNREPQWRKQGSIYAFTRTSSPGMVKIGYTTGKVFGRLESWQRSCGYEPWLVAVADDVPHVIRAEALVHHELSEHWRVEPRCKHNPLCAGGHREWFEIDVDTAEQTIKRVAKWIMLARPYDEHGFLTRKWRNIICDLEKRDVVVTSANLLKAYDDLTSHERMRAIDSSQRKAIPKIKRESEIVAQTEFESELSAAEKDVSSLDQAMRLLLGSGKVGQLLDVLITDRRMYTSVDRRPKIEQPVMPMGVLVS